MENRLSQAQALCLLLAWGLGSWLVAAVVAGRVVRP